MINATEAAQKAVAWQNLEKSFGVRAVGYMRSVLEPGIDAATKNGQNSLAQQDISHEFLTDLIAALQSLGYSTSISGSTFTVSW